MSRIPTEYLRHILDETNYLLESSQNMIQEQFDHDETFKRAAVRSIEIIGEATKKLPDDFRNQNPQVEWRMMAGMRDRLIHAYFGVDYEIVWDVVSNKIPELNRQIKRILDRDNDE